MREIYLQLDPLRARWFFCVESSGKGMKMNNVGPVRTEALKSP